jgi:hypothetical protein
MPVFVPCERWAAVDHDRSFRAKAPASSTLARGRRRSSAPATTGPDRRNPVVAFAIARHPSRKEELDIGAFPVAALVTTADGREQKRRISDRRAGDCLGRRSSSTRPWDYRCFVKPEATFLADPTLVSA